MRLLCCEGRCSAPGRQWYLKRRPFLYEVGYSPDDERMVETSRLTHTLHYFVRLRDVGSCVFAVWACSVCGAERVYGAEEPEVTE